MAMPRIALALLPLASLIAASCQRPAAPAAEAPPSRSQSAAPAPAEAAEAGSAKSASGENGDGITMRYTCEQGHSAAIARGGIARVSLADGRVVEIPRIADSSPPRYSGVALSFAVGSDGATLGQHEVGGFACHEAD
jgi:hypothetical protein